VKFSRKLLGKWVREEHLQNDLFYVEWDVI